MQWVYVDTGGLLVDKCRRTLHTIYVGLRNVLSSDLPSLAHLSMCPAYSRSINRPPFDPQLPTHASSSLAVLPVAQGWRKGYHVRQWEGASGPIHGYFVHRTHVHDGWKRSLHSRLSISTVFDWSNSLRSHRTKRASSTNVAVLATVPRVIQQLTSSVIESIRLPVMNQVSIHFYPLFKPWDTPRKHAAILRIRDKS